jgi:hypothetical protein
LSSSYPQQSQGGVQADTSGDYLAAVRILAGDPEQLEQLYQSVRTAGDTRVFAAAIATLRQEAPDNLLYGAWYYRLRQPAADVPPGRLAGAWMWVVPLSILLALAFWVLSDPSLTLAGSVPLLALLAAPLTALALVLFLAGAGRRNYAYAVVAGIALLGLLGYLLGIASLGDSAQLTLIALHAALLAWGAIGLAALGWRSAARERFAFLSKSLEAIGTGGVVAIAGGIFAGITLGLFQALGVALSNPLVRLLAAAVAGLAPLVAVATVYDPSLRPVEQEFARGFGRILAVLMRVLLALSLVVLLIYVAVIPFYFFAPFHTREVLIVYNLMLFGIMGLLIGVTPLRTDDLSPQLRTILRAGIVSVALLVTLVSLYALSATVYRTVTLGPSMNRVTVIGWNVINIGILVALLVGQMGSGRSTGASGGGWTGAVQRAIAGGALAYVAWAAFVSLVLPWLF